ncbi:MAG TPA: PQQ-dependent sugar dehydrogenase [Gemmataceae bacterium]|nr:PQQ-dependent sugar dehydrogenase [Gemmataceae bacterium]
MMTRFPLRRRPAPRTSAPRRAGRLTVEQLEDRTAPAIFISDATVVEGHAGTANAVFTVSLSAASSQTVTVGFATANHTATALRVARLATDLSRPVFVTSPPGDTERLFIVEQHTGRIRIYNRSTGTINATPFLTVPGVNTGSEQGLLGLAFHPNYADNGFFYVYFTSNTAPPGVTPGAAGVSIIRRYQVSANPNVANPTSATNILAFGQPQSNHNAGWIAFGPDGFLYIASGDGGGSDDNDAGHTDGIGNAQDPSDDNFLGKILRIDVNGDAFPEDPERNYAIPPTNPFVGADGNEDAIWAYGLRNPWRPSFDRLTNDLYIADVGQNTREEINVQPAGTPGGRNYEWRLREGTIATPTGGVGGPRPPGGIQPIYDYPHDNSALGGFSVTGGYVYRGPIPELQGQYFFSDFVSQRLWSLRWDGSPQSQHNGTNFTDRVIWTGLLAPDGGTINGLSSFGEDAQGNLYLVELGSGTNGELFQIVEGADYLPTSGQLTFSPGQTTRTVTVAVLGDRLDEPSETFFVQLANPFNDTIADSEGEGTITDDDDGTTLVVSSFTPTRNGFTVVFNRPLDASVLNLYDDAAGGLGPADVTLVGNTTGLVRGSLVVDPSNTRVTFVATGGVLPRDVYTVTLRSAANGFKDTGGNLLDGNFDRQAGGNYSGSFRMELPPVVVSVPDFLRGPGQPVNVPADSLGLPLRLSSSDSITSVSLILRYNPSLLRITEASVAPGLPAGSTVDRDLSTPGLVTLSFRSPPLPAGISTFVILTADVPDTAGYTLKHVLDLSVIAINASGFPAPITAVDDDGIHVVAYPGDTTGNGRYSSADAVRALRVGIGIDPGFPGYQLADPVRIADVTGNGAVSATDATRILQEALGIDRPEVPPLPATLPPITVSGPDPLLSLPANLRARPGDTVTVPINLDPSDGLQSLDLALAYDADRLELAAVEPGTLTGDFDLFQTNPQPGTLRAALARLAGPIAGRGAGSVLEVVFRIRSDAPPGPAVINLLEELAPTRTWLNEGGLVLTPAPSDAAGDLLDGQIIVLADPPARVERVTGNGGRGRRARIRSLTVTFNTLVGFAGSPADAFRLIGPRGPVPLRGATVREDNGPRTVVRLVLPGQGVRLAALRDGRYTLVVDGEQVVDGFGQMLDGDAVEVFFRLLGEGNWAGRLDRGLRARR